MRLLLFIALFSLISSPLASAMKHSHPHDDGPQSSYYYPNAVKSLLSMVKSLNITMTNPPNICWRDSYGRGVGHVVDSCPASSEKNGALCYPVCKEDYYGVGPICWEHCDEGYTDEGALCAKNLKVIGADNKACPWYDKCGLIRKDRAHPCSKCPDSSWRNDGCFCTQIPHIYAKKSYGRGVGSPMVCKPTEDEDAALCYPFCKADTKGVGPVCWYSCPSTAAVSIGALCCDTEKACTDKVEQMAMGIMSAVAAAVLGGASPSAIVNDIKKAIEAILGFVLPICNN